MSPSFVHAQHAAQSVLQVLKSLRASNPSGQLATDRDLWRQLTLRLRNQLHVAVCASIGPIDSHEVPIWKRDVFPVGFLQ